MIMKVRDQEDVDGRSQFELLELLADSMAMSVMITTADSDSDPVIVYVNEAFTALTGYEFEDVIGKTPKILQGPQTEREVMRQLRQDLAASGRFHGQAHNYRKNGESFLMDWEIVPFGDATGNRRYYVTIQRAATS